MFEIGWTELLLIAVVAIVVIGPKDLPRAMRVVGQWTARIKRMARDFQGQFNDALKEAELDGVQKEIQSLAKINPLATVRKELTAVEASIRKDMTIPAMPAVSATPAVSPAVSQPPAAPDLPKVEP